MNGPEHPSARIEGLCGWRAVLMLGGLVLHATMGEENRPVFAAINIASGSFRMGAFFMISGLLSGSAIRRRADPAQWMRQRLFQLGVPTLFAIVVLCPLTTAMLAVMAARGGSPAPPVLNIYHLWFMVALLGYTLLAYVAHRADQRWHLFDYLDARARFATLTQPMILITLGAVSFILMVATMYLSDRWVPDRYWPLLAQSRSIVGYAPIFLLGFAVARAPALRDRLTASAGIPVLILASATIGHLCWQWTDASLFWAGGRAWTQDILLVGAAAWCPPAAAVLILRSAIALRRVPMTLQRLSDASFTMYILHYPIIVAVKLVTASWMLGPWTGFVLAIAVSGLLSYWFHVLIVTRSSTASLLLNGRHQCAPMRRSVAAAEPRPAVAPV